MSPIAGQDVIDRLGHMVDVVKECHDVRYAQWDGETREERAAAQERHTAEFERANDKWQEVRAAAIEKYRYTRWGKRKSDEEATMDAYRAFDPAMFSVPCFPIFHPDRGPQLPKWYAEANELLTAARTFPNATFVVRTGLIRAIEDTYRDQH